MRPSRRQLEQARRESRGQRSGYGETADHIWHRLTPGSYVGHTVGGVAVIACSGEARAVFRLAGDMVDREVCPQCRAKGATDGTLG